MRESVIKETENAKATYQLGYECGQKAQKGELYCLLGDLGVGKTVFTQGLLTGLE